MPAVLVVAATRAEARHVPPGLPLLITGIGKVAAATAVASALARRDGAVAPQLVVNIGTAGALRDGLDGLFVPGTVINHDLSAALLRGLGVAVTDQIELPDGDDMVLATGDSFVADPDQRAALAPRAGLVDMEGFAVAWACQHAGVPCRLVKHVSDNADGGAMSWADALEESATALGDWLAQNVGGTTEQR
jgi:predicted 5'-methylthioadenosine/S-adenosylhomocysteine nucleosidase